MKAIFFLLRLALFPVVKRASKLEKKECSFYRKEFLKKEKGVSYRERLDEIQRGSDWMGASEYDSHRAQIKALP